MMLLKACKWIVTTVIVPTIVGVAGSMIASILLAHFHLA